MVPIALHSSEKFIALEMAFFLNNEFLFFAILLFRMVYLVGLNIKPIKGLFDRAQNLKRILSWKRPQQRGMVLGVVLVPFFEILWTNRHKDAQYICIIYL